MRIIVNEERGLSQRSRINVKSALAALIRVPEYVFFGKNSISCLQQQRHLLQHESA